MQLFPDHQQHRCGSATVKRSLLTIVRTLPFAVELGQGTARRLSNQQQRIQFLRQQTIASASTTVQSDNNSSTPKVKAGVAVEPGLYIVSTPIGNLQDITLRALNVLKAADVVLAEDTRHTRKLLNAYDIKTPLISYHAHNERGKEAYILDMLTSGQAVALVSDAGTPAISDPGSALVAAAVAAGHRVVPIPGASAVLSAIVASGLSTERFMFVGFLPPKTGARRKALEELGCVQATTLVFYVPPHGLTAVLEDVRDVLGGDSRCCIAREVTKMHEEFVRGTVADVMAVFADREPRGEFVLLVESGSGRSPVSQQEVMEAAVRKLLEEGVSVSSTSRQVSVQLGVGRKVVYEVAQRMSDAVGDAVQGT